MSLAKNCKGFFSEIHTGVLLWFFLNWLLEFLKQFLWRFLLNFFFEDFFLLRVLQGLFLGFLQMFLLGFLPVLLLELRQDCFQRLINTFIWDSSMSFFSYSSSSSFWDSSTSFSIFWDSFKSYLRDFRFSFEDLSKSSFTGRHFQRYNGTCGRIRRRITVTLFQFYAICSK